MKDAPPAGALDTRAKAGGAASPASGGLARFAGWLSARPLAQTAVALALALAIRAYFLIQSGGMMEGDEAILGIQAERILHGARPIYMYGQAYMASWDAYLTAPLIALFGPSGTILHVVPLLESLLLVPLMGSLAARMFRTERARFPAMLLAALPPVYVGVVELHMWGGYIETLVLGAALMLVTLRIAGRWALAQPTHWLWLFAGLLTGFAWWIDPLIIYYLLACALWLILPALARVTLARAPEAGSLATQAPGALKGALAFIGAAIIGASPAILYLITTPGALTPGQALPYLSGSGPSSLTSLLRLNLIGYFALLDAPRVAGVAIPWDPFTAHKALNVLVAIVPTLAALLAVWAAALIVVGAARVLRLPRADQRHAAVSPVWTSALPVILAVVIFLVFWRSPSSVTLGRNLDTVGRYAVPLTASISLLLVYAYLYLPSRAARALVRLPRWDSERRRALAVRVLPLALFALLLASYGAPYIVTDQAQAMESTYSLGLRFPADHADLLTYLEQRHITHVWADHWVGNVAMYLTGERVTAADYYDVAVYHSRDRFPDAMAAVARADRPSFVFRDTRATPWMATAMTRLGVQYEQARFGDIWVITPLSRTVTPLELARAGCDITPLAFDQPSCDQLASLSAQP
jgi:hypothetical protein